MKSQSFSSRGSLRSTIDRALSGERVKNLEHAQLDSTNVWDLLHTKFIDVRFMEDGDFSVHAGTLVGLLFYLCECARDTNEGTESSKMETLFIDNFILFYRWFMDPPLFFAKLYEVYDIPERIDHESIPVMSPKRGAWRSKEELKKAVSYLVLSWYKAECELIEKDEELKNLFTSRYPEINFRGSVYDLLNDTATLKSSKNTLNDANDEALKHAFRSGNALKSLRFFDRPPATVALHLTALEFDYFSRVKHLEFLNNAWTSKKKHESAPGIMEMIRFFNKLSLWAVGMILDKESATERAVVVEKLIEVTEELLELNNFNTAMALHSSLTVNAVHRLHETFSKVKKSKMKTLQKFDDFFSAGTNFQEYRALVEQENSFCIPFLGLHLRDLVYVHDSAATVFQKASDIPITNKSARASRPTKKASVTSIKTVTHVHNYINMKKIRSLASVVNLIQNYQRQTLPPQLLTTIEPQLLSLIRLFVYPRYDNDALYAISLLREPKPSLEDRERLKKRNSRRNSNDSSSKAEKRSKLSTILKKLDVMNVFSIKKKEKISRVNRMSSGYGENWIHRIYTDGGGVAVDVENAKENREEQFAVMVDTILNLYDANANGELSLEEFQELSSNFPCIGAFSMIDTNGDGIITREELLDYFRKMDQNQLREENEEHTFMTVCADDVEDCKNCYQCGMSLAEKSTPASKSVKTPISKCSGCSMLVHGSCTREITISCSEFKYVASREKNELNETQTPSASPVHKMHAVPEEGEIRTEIEVAI
eukprot:Nk52_evm5s2462 gene=Nk52_evmTU5s2462